MTRQRMSEFSSNRAAAIARIYSDGLTSTTRSKARPLEPRRGPLFTHAKPKPSPAVAPARTLKTLGHGHRRGAPLPHARSKLAGPPDETFARESPGMHWRTGRRGHPDRPPRRAASPPAAIGRRECAGHVTGISGIEFSGTVLITW